jgi:DNA-binding transcriptional ArsR family regulator
VLKHDGGAGEPAKAAPIFAALGDPVRLAMVVRLCKSGPLSTIELTRGASVTRQGLTKHMRVLEEAGLVTSARLGRDRQWQMQAGQLVTLRDYLDQISEEWDLRLERLRAFVEDSA